MENPVYHKNKYEDIISMPHHISINRPQMDRGNRAAQFSPFAALTGYEAAVAETARLTERKTEISEETRAELDERLKIIMNRLPERSTVSITYFEPDGRKSGGSYETINGIVRRIDETERTIILADQTKVSIDDICAIEGEIYRFPDDSYDDSQKF
ncbi:MAG: hypothetical protein ACI39R_07890 [Lachnospiraceae bacterium]